MPIQVFSYIPKIVMISLSIALICVIGISVIMAENGRSAQRIADLATKQNQELQDELRCLRPAALAYDKALSEIQLDIARGLAALADGNPINVADALRSHSAALAQALTAREDSIKNCKK